MAKNSYENYTHKQLVAEIKKLNQRKTYGLVWEEERVKEKFEKQSEGKLPVLIEDTHRGIMTDPELPVNLLIEGDNYNSLSVLNYTHSKSIDVIYIDPPYNTGNIAWKYNNNYVDKEDTFRHSKWVSFMYKRLKLAKKLLKSNGIIVCAIDDYEIHNLRQIMDEIFGYENRLSTIVVIHNPGGRQDDKFVATAHEYMLLYAKNKENARVKFLDVTDEKSKEYIYKDKYGRYKTREFRRSGSNSRRNDRPKMWYPIYIDKKTLEISLNPTRNSEELLPIDANGIERVWRWGKESLMKKKDKYIEVKRSSDTFVLFVKERETDNKGEKAKSFWNKAAYSAANGTLELKKIFGESEVEGKIFDYPKSPYLMYDILKILTDEECTILDFFGGSGTTAQAVLSLNRILGGKRKFILCTNNEIGPKQYKELLKKGLTEKEMLGEGVCRKVTYPRISKVISGYKFIGLNNDLIYEKKITVTSLNIIDQIYEEIELLKNKFNYEKYKLEIKDGYLRLLGINFIKGAVEGLGGNLKYYLTDFVNSEPTHQNKRALTEKSTQMLCIKEDTFEKVLTNKNFRIYKNHKKYTAILFNELVLDDFKEIIKKYTLPISIYIFSLEGDDFKEEFEDLKNNIVLCSIPEAILKVYRRIYEMAKPKKQ